MNRAERIACTTIVPAAFAAVLLTSAPAFGQAAQRAAFVANNGNLEGSVSSYVFDEDDSLILVDHLITGESEGFSDFDYGTNAYSISITPNGKYLATGHATSDPPPGWQPGRQVTILYVHPDATLEEITTFLTPSTPLDVQWISNEHLAVTRSNFGGTNEVIVYEFDESTNQVVQIDAQFTGSFNTSLALHPSGEYLFAQDSTQYTIRSFRINTDGTLTETDTQGTNNIFPLGIGVSPNGKWVYGGGGISGGGDKIVGVTFDEDSESLSTMPGSPYVSPGASPKQVVVSSDNQYAIAGHGTDATVRTFAIDQQTGALFSTGHMFDVGAQGTLGEIAVLDHLLLVPDRSTIFDGVRGLYSFTIEANGSLTQNGPIVDSNGIEPNYVVGWSPKPDPECPADLTGSGEVGVPDLLQLIDAWGRCPGCPEDLTGSGDVGVPDLLMLIGEWGPCP